MTRRAGEPSAADGRARPGGDGRTVVVRGLSILILAWSSIWIFFFQHASRWQNELLLLPALSLLGLAALAASARRPLPGPWVYWLGALLVYAALGSALNPSVVASWGRMSGFLWSLALGLPVLLALSQARLDARTLCGVCIVVALASLLDNVGLDLRAGAASLVNSDPASEGVRIEIAVEGELHRRSQRAASVWTLFLTWIALAALRPAARRDWLTAAIVLVLSALVVATDSSWATKVTYAGSIAVFFAALRVPRIVQRIALAALVVAFLGAPLGAKAGWLWFTSNPELFLAGADPEVPHKVKQVKRRIAKRLVHWEYWAELIERRPWTGLGFHAYTELPRMQPREFLGARPAQPRIPQDDRSSRWDTFRTGSPHSFPLQVWGELGAFGVLLAAGLAASLLVNAGSARPGDAGAAARVALLAAVLLVFFVDRAAWTQQNVFQLVLTAGLAAGTLTGGGRRAAAALPGMTLRREKVLILAVLALGLLVAAGNRMRIHLADGRYAAEHTTLDPGRGVLQHRGKEIALDGKVAGHVDGLRRDGRRLTVSGWAYDPAATGEAVQVLVFDGSELIGVTRTGRTRPELQHTSRRPNLDLLFAGFRLGVSRHPAHPGRQSALRAVFLRPSGPASIADVTHRTAPADPAE